MIGPDKPILLVEDNEDDIFALKRALKQEKIPNPLHVVTNGQEAIDYLSGANAYADREKHPVPAIVFLDLKLPYLNGYDVLAWVRQQPELGALVIVVLTSSDETRDHQKAFALGANSYMVKPTAPEDIGKFLASMLNWSRNPQSGPVLIRLKPGA